MAGKRKVTVEITGDDRDFKRALGSSDKATSKWAGKVGKAGKAAALGLAAGVAAAGYALWDFSKAAGEDQASQAKLAQTMKKTQKATADQVGATEKWVDTLSRASGVADDELRPALSKLMIAGESTAQAQKHVALAMDIATAKGVSLTSVTQGMAKASTGTVGALGRLGIATKDASGKTLTYRQILANAAKTMGGAATAAADTYQGKMKRLGVAANEAKESIGAALLPVLTKMADWVLTKGIPMLQRFGAWFQEKVLPVLRRVAAFISVQMHQALVSLREAVARNRPQLDQLGRALRQAGEWAMKYLAPALKWLYGTEFKALIKAIGFGIDWIGKLVDQFVFMKNTVAKLGGALAAPFIASFNAIKNAWNATLGGLSFTMPDWPGVPGRGQTWSIPNMAHGGIVPATPGGRLIRVAEAGRDEAIVPLGRGTRGMGDTHVHVHVHGHALASKREIANEVLDALKTVRSGGRQLGLA